MSETTELRIDDRLIMENGEEHPGHDPQSDIRARIAEKYEQARLDEMREQHEAHGLPLPEVDGIAEDQRAPVEAQEPPQAAPAPAPVAEQPPPPGPQPVQQQPQYIPMMLPDGRQTYVTPEQDSQLAAYGVAELARSQSAPPPQQPVYTPPAPSRSALSDEHAGSIAQRLSFGTVDEQKQAVMDLADSLRTQERADVEAIRRQAASDALQHVRLEQNLNIIGQEYPEIFHDPVLTQVAALQLDALRRIYPQFQDRSDLDQYREACNSVRQRFQPTRAVQSTPSGVSRQAALDRKRSAPSIPTAVDRRMTSDDGNAPVRAETASEVIRNMRRSRGQPVT